MAWLIDKRRSLKGQVDWVRRQITRYERALEELPHRMVQLETELAGLDAVFKLHAVEFGEEPFFWGTPVRQGALDARARAACAQSRPGGGPTGLWRVNTN